MRQFLPRFIAAVEQVLPAEASGRLCIAYSGGLDSTVLLHATIAALRHLGRYSLFAVHIDHQLQAAAQAWADHCTAHARELGVECVVRQVQVIVEDDGIEAAARRARYAALRQLLEPGTTLLTAHHADDQLESMLLALARGAGVTGLAAMPTCQRFAAGWHARPLLEFTRAEIAAWAHDHQLRWIEDPSNAGEHFDRNYLRHAVLPLLYRRWPAVARNANRAASHLSEAHQLLVAVAREDLARAAVGPCLNWDVLQSLSAARRRNVLRHWIAGHGATMPSTRKLAALERDMTVAAADRQPCVRWGDFAVRRYRGLLYGERRDVAAVWPEQMQWDWRAGPLILPGGAGALRMEGAAKGLDTAKLPAQLVVRFRSGGERIKPAGDAHRRQLKKLLQTQHVLPWWRERMPLLYARDELIAVADLWTVADWHANAGGLRIVWDERPAIQAVDP